MKSNNNSCRKQFKKAYRLSRKNIAYDTAIGAIFIENNIQALANYCLTVRGFKKFTIEDRLMAYKLSKVSALPGSLGIFKRLTHFA